jgi:hypothetical protein
LSKRYTKWQAKMTELRKRLDASFGKPDLSILCFDLGLDYESLSGDNKSEKAMHLVRHVDRTGRVPDLVELCAKERPLIPWSDCLGDLPARPDPRERVASEPTAPIAAPPPPDVSDTVVVLAGCGASACLGLEALDGVIGPEGNFGQPIDDRVRETINQTWGRVRAQGRGRTATFEALIDRLRTYARAAALMESDHVFQSKLGTVPDMVYTGMFKRMWDDALVHCFRIMLEHYGPRRIDPYSPAFATTLQLLQELARLNDPHLHVFTTNYDCSYQVLASHNDELSFVSHIDNQRGHFRDGWYYARRDLEDKDLPLVYVHRLHGCVAWFREPTAIHGTREVYGAGGELEIVNEEFLNTMCIKSTSTEEIGTTPAFRLAFSELHEHLRHCKVLFVWGYSFQDREVLRTIINALENRSHLFKIVYLDPYLPKVNAVENIRRTLSTDPVPIDKPIDLTRIDWVVQDGHDKMVSQTVAAIKAALKEGESKHV